MWQICVENMQDQCLASEGTQKHKLLVFQSDILKAALPLCSNEVSVWEEAAQAAAAKSLHLVPGPETPLLLCHPSFLIRDTLSQGPPCFKDPP